MIVKCKFNTGKDLRQFEYNEIESDEMFGRFGTSALSKFPDLELDKNYFVLGIINGSDYPSYLLAINGFPYDMPCHLFEIVHNHIPTYWKYNFIEKPLQNYVEIDALINSFIGYEEFANDIYGTYERLFNKYEKNELNMFIQQIFKLKEYYRLEGIDIETLVYN